MWGAQSIYWITFGKLWYLGWLIGLWLRPAFFIGRDGNWQRSASPWLYPCDSARLSVAVCYPISQLSSLSASSMWMPLVPDVFARLAQKPAVMLGFFGLSAIALAVFAIGFRWAFMIEGQWEFLFVGAPLVVIAALVYARLLGRLAFALRFTTGLFVAKKKKKRKPEDERENKEVASESPEPAESPHPPDLPPISTPDGELVGYGILSEADPPRPRKRVKAEVAEADAEEVPKPTAEPRPPRKPSPENAVDRGRAWTDEDDEEATPYGVHEAGGEDGGDGAKGSGEADGRGGGAIEA